jgi:tRNA(Arg) A34 adenosine deaminase TadA
MYRKGTEKTGDKLQHKEHLCVRMVYGTEESRRGKETKLFSTILNIGMRQKATVT